MHRFTSLKDSELRSYLAKIRRIANMTDEDALAEVDELIHNLALRGVAKGGALSTEPKGEENSLELDAAEDDLRQFRVELRRHRRELKSDAVDEYDVRSLLVEADGLGEDWPSKKIKCKLREQVQVLRTEAHELAKQMRVGAARREISDFRRELAQYRRELKRGKVDNWIVKGLRGRAESLGENWDSREVRNTLASELDKVRSEATELANSIAVANSIQQIQDTKKEILNSIATVKKILRILKQTEEILVANSAMTATLEQLILETRERCAWFRARKKLADARLAQEMGKEKRTQKLQLEAQRLLQEDWRTTFGDRQCPSVEQTRGH